MNKLLAFAAALSIASPIAFAFPSVAAADTTGTGNSANAAICQQVASYYGLSQGNCVAYLNGNVNANTVCHVLQSVYPAYFAATYSSFGACVADYNSLLGKS
ncbi:MAG TPA: hypothetical protein VF459_09790 [Caulobacteraceae bacterium]